jgi:hypothetical protein
MSATALEAFLFSCTQHGPFYKWFAADGVHVADCPRCGSRVGPGQPVGDGQAHLRSAWVPANGLTSCVDCAGDLFGSRFRCPPCVEVASGRTPNWGIMPGQAWTTWLGEPDAEECGAGKGIIHAESATGALDPIVRSSSRAGGVMLRWSAGSMPGAMSSASSRLGTTTCRVGRGGGSQRGV